MSDEAQGRGQDAIKKLAWDMWQVLGAIWGIHATKEQARICNYFHDLAESGETNAVLFPINLESERIASPSATLPMREDLDTEKALDGAQPDAQEKGKIISASN